MTEKLIDAQDEYMEYFKRAKKWYVEAFPHHSQQFTGCEAVAEYMANQDGKTLTHYRAKLQEIEDLENDDD